MTRIYFFSILLAGSLSLAAQTGVVSGPSSGLVFDSAAQSVRPIRGVPGAATFGDAIDTGHKLSAAWISPGQESMFARDTAGALRFFAIGANGVAELPLAGVSISPARVIFSPSGTAAALFADGQAQIVTGLPASPKVADAFTLAHAVRNPRAVFASLALSDDGAYLIFSAGGTIQLANASEGSRVLMNAGFDAAVAFAPDTHDAAVAGRGTGVVLIHDAANTAVEQTLAGDEASLTQVAGMAFSSDGRRLYLASGTSSSVIAFDAASGARTDLPCSVPPSGLTRMGSSFRLNNFSTGPLWLVDTAGANPRVVFVPAWKQAL